MAVRRKSLQVRLGVSRKDNTQSYILYTEDGTVIPAVLVDEEVMFTATEQDVRKGKVAASAQGVIHGKAIDYPYKYAEINPATGLCTGMLCATTKRADSDSLVPVSMDYSDYMGKYYIDGAWYEDAASTKAWSPSV